MGSLIHVTNVVYHLCCDVCGRWEAEDFFLGSTEKVASSPFFFFRNKIPCKSMFFFGGVCVFSSAATTQNRPKTPKKRELTFWDLKKGRRFFIIFLSQICPPFSQFFGGCQDSDIESSKLLCFRQCQGPLSSPDQMQKKRTQLMDGKFELLRSAKLPSEIRIGWLWNDMYIYMINIKCYEPVIFP